LKSSTVISQSGEDLTIHYQFQ